MNNVVLSFRNDEYNLYQDCYALPAGNTTATESRSKMKERIMMVSKLLISHFLGNLFRRLERLGKDNDDFQK